LRKTCATQTEDLEAPEGLPTKATAAQAAEPNDEEVTNTANHISTNLSQISEKVTAQAVLLEDDLPSVAPAAKPKASLSSEPQVDPPSLACHQEEEAIETLDELLWPLLPLYGQRAATLQGNALAFGAFVAVDQTVVSHELLYVLRYDDGDLQHLDTGAATDALALALATVKDEAPPKPLPKHLRRRNADAHSATLGSSSGSQLTNERTLSRQETDAHLLDDQLWAAALLGS
jgi:hypothetical protein